MVSRHIVWSAKGDTMRDDVLRTPDDRFVNLPDFPFQPNYVDIDGYRVHYLDEGPKDGPAVFMLHGEPSWSYLYRKMIPVLSAAGLRSIVPDLIGFGRSDKPKSRATHTYPLHVEVMTELFRGLQLDGVTFFGQDWGGLIGLRVVANEPDRFARIVVANTGLPDAPPEMAERAYAGFKKSVADIGQITPEQLAAETTFPRWVALSQTIDVFPVGQFIAGRAGADVVAAYDAPFVDESYKEGPRAMPPLVPSQLAENHRVWKNVFEKWEKPLLTAFGDRDPITAGGEAPFQKRVPGAKDQPHVTIKGAGHFLQETHGEELAQVIVDFVQRTS